jgi:hypothetical protein
MEQKIPAIMRYLYALFLFLVLFGVLLPLMELLFSISPLLLILSFSLVISAIFFVATTFYPFLNREINR